MADDAPPAPAISTPYLVHQSDGSTSTFYLHTDRHPTQGEVADYAASQGQAFAGFPTPAPEPAAPSAAPGEDSSLARRAWNVIAPQRSFVSQLPGMGGALGGGMYGAALGAPLGPPGMFVGGLIGAGLGGAGGEAVQYGGEKLLGAGPAEEGTLAQRVTSGGLRGAASELVGAPLRLATSVPWSAVRPVAEAAREVAPILTGTAERVVVPEVAGPAAQTLAARAAAESANRLPDWWAANAAGKAPAEIVKAWGKMTAEEQALTAGEHLPALQTIMSQLGTSGAKTLGEFGWGSGGAAVPAFLTGHHVLGGLASVVPAYDVLAKGGNRAMSYALTNPAGARVLSWLPGAAKVAGPVFGLGTRAVAAPIVGEQWPPATTVWPASPASPY